VMPWSDVPPKSSQSSARSVSKLVAAELLICTKWDSICGLFFVRVRLNASYTVEFQFYNDDDAKWSTK
jgi:hypothetical protein